ncbi:MAG: phosphoribosylamine--glycine ligase [Cardiobacteriaceae bacterium]|nr:phosphoribosylamine--glycine ligase [Cardiobacteriaceae bacterium]
MLKVLIIGSGGREHALAWKLGQDKRIGKIYVAPGNAGTEQLEKAENVNLTTVAELVKFAKDKEVGMTLVGSEALLVEGIVDAFRAERLNIFGPNKNAARLEGSKKFAKEFMQKYGVRTAAFASFDDAEKALEYLKTCPYPTVIKASGLAAGKGVVICQNQTDAEKTVQAMMKEKIFGEAGAEIVIEEFLTGFEVSVLTFCDGKTILPMKTAKDHKTIGEYNTGPNTGGMGSICPHPTMTDEQYQDFLDNISAPTLRGIQAENLQFTGVIFFGLMVSERGVYLLEYNARFGDPETQSVLALLETPLLTPIYACLDGKLDTVKLEWKDEVAVCLVAASAGYPGKFQKGIPIYKIEQASFFSQVFIAGAQRQDDEIHTSGGRVLNVVATGKDLAAARKTAYHAIDLIEFEGKTFRRDIGEV